MTSRVKLTLVFVGLFWIMLAACTPQAGGLPGTGGETPPAETPAVTPELPPQVVLAVQAWLSEQLRVPVEELEIVAVERMDWQDSCLGLGGPAESCLQAITPGWRVTFAAGGQEYEIRTDETGSTIRSPELPPQAVLEAQTWLSEQLGIPLEELEIVDTERTDWQDSCLGLGGPAESCLQAITPGWRIIFAAGGQEYEIRTDETGSIIRMAEAAGEDTLAGTQWTLESFGLQDAEEPALPGTTVTLEFEGDGQAGGSGGCNTYGAQYEVQDGRLSFSEVVTTEKACLEEGVMEQEQRYYEALQTAGQFELDGDRLVISYDNGQGALNFVRTQSGSPAETPAADNPLAGTQWNLESYGPVGSETPAVGETPVTLEFGEDGQAGGSGGCNSYGAEVQVEGNTLSFGQITSTLMACADEGVMEQEQQFFQALQNASEFELAGDRLTILYDDGQGVLNFIK